MIIARHPEAREVYQHSDGTWWHGTADEQEYGPWKDMDEAYEAFMLYLDDLNHRA